MFIELGDLEERELAPGYHVRLVHSEHMTFAHWRVEEGAELPLHHHPHEQVAHVLEGRFELTVGDDTRQLEPGQVAVIPGHVPHGGRALTPCRLLDVFYPTREDYRG